MKSKIIIDKEALSAYHLKWENEEKVYYVDFEIYDISWVTYNGKTGDSEYPSYRNLENYTISSDYEPSEETKPKISGHIKWDGCCNYEYNEEPMFHQCGLNGFRQELKQIEAVYILSAEIMGNTCDLEMMGLK